MSMSVEQFVAVPKKDRILPCAWCGRRTTRSRMASHLWKCAIRRAAYAQELVHVEELEPARAPVPAELERIVKSVFVEESQLWVA